MGLKDSLQQVLARLAGGSVAPDSPVVPLDDGDIEESCRKLEAKLGYSFRDISLLKNALLHRSHVHVTGQGRERSNERLEFLGDAILATVICQTLFERFPDYLEGDLTKIKSMLVSRITCARIAKKFSLHKFLKVGKGMASSRALSGSLAAGLLEALIAAVYVDGGFNVFYVHELAFHGDVVVGVDTKI